MSRANSVGRVTRMVRLGLIFFMTGYFNADARAIVGSAVSPVLHNLDSGTASALAKLPLRCIGKEFPNKMDHVMNDAGEVQSPRALHPAFFGCFDWHSSVHGHWMLVRLLRTHPNLAQAGEIRSALDSNLSASNILSETAYLDAPNRKSFERTYGWAWLLKLAEELHTWNDPDARRWSANLAPLAGALARRYEDFLPRQNYAIRTGVHPNTAFGIAFALDYARSTGATGLERVLVERARFYFEQDRNYPASWEPGGEDFFSPALMEADLMRRVLAPREFRAWFEKFLPDVRRKAGASLLRPAVVTDRTDPKLVHLDGLNLSRAWCMFGIAAALPSGSSEARVLRKSAQEHLAATLPHITSGNYEGEHWLATFAVYALEAAGADGGVTPRAAR